MVTSIVILALVCLPLYLFPSGGLQLTHLFLLLSFLALILRKNFYLRINILQELVLVLGLYALVVELVYILNGAPFKSVMSALHILFSFVFLTAFSFLADKKNGAFLMKYALFVSAFIALGGVIALGFSVSVDNGSARSVGTFNNPNQLGYYALCFGCIVWLLRETHNLTLIAYLVGMLLALFLSAVSLSKASSVSLLMVFALSFFKSRPLFVVPFCMAVLGIAIVFAPLWLDVLEDLSIFHRLSSIGSGNDDSAEARGYHILLDRNWNQLLFGSGLAGVKAYVGHEVHSTIASFYANYGLIGGALFSAILVVWMNRIFKSFGFVGLLIICGAPMAYGLTHNGSRFTIFWLLVALSFAVASQTKFSCCNYRGTLN